MITGEGASLTAGGYVSDVAGNVTSATSRAVQIDRSAPTTAISAPTGWTNSSVTVTFAATDNLSGVGATYFSLDGDSTQVGSTLPISDEGRHTIRYWSVDNAGNVEALQTASVSIDRNAPTITHSLAPTPNAAGLNNTDVGVTFICADSRSGIAFCSSLQAVTGEAQSIPVVATATDYAGNSSHETVLVSIDRTPPTITPALDRSPNASGWYGADVIVSFTCGDALSGVVSCAQATTLEEGAGQSASGTATDAAGNQASSSLTGIDVDETAPTVSFTGNAGEYAVDQTVAIGCSASDALSGVASTTCADLNAPAWTFGLGTTSRSASAVDKAGNSGTGSVSFTVTVNPASLKALVSGFSTSSSVASALGAKIDAISAAPNANAKAGKLGAFNNELSAQTGKALTQAQAALLGQLGAAI